MSFTDLNYKSPFVLIHHSDISLIPLPISKSCPQRTFHIHTPSIRSVPLLVSLGVYIVTLQNQEVGLSLTGP